MSVGTKIAKIAVIIAAFVLLVFLRVLWGSYSEYKRAQSYTNKGDRSMAAEHFSRAIRFYFPFNPYVKKSISGMIEIGDEYEKDGDNGKCLEVYELMRSSIYSTRNLWLPHRKYVELADRKIAALRSTSGALSAGDKRIPSEGQVLDVLKKDKSPSVFFSVLALMGFFGWICSTVYFILRVMGEEPFAKRRALLTGVLFFVFYLMWVISLSRA